MAAKTKAEPKPKSTWLTGGLARCETCGKIFTSFRNCQGLGARHAKATGHVVVGELHFAFRYEGPAR